MKKFQRLQNTLSSTFIQGFIVAFILILISCMIYKNVVSLPPTGRHAWSQSDHFAIALNYADDLNFFKPRTYLLNPYMVPAPPALDKLEGITKADSPLSE